MLQHVFLCCYFEGDRKFYCCFYYFLKSTQVSKTTAHIRTTLLWSNWTLRSPSLPLYSPSTCLTKGTPSITTSAGLRDGAKLEVRGDVKRNKVSFYICVWLKKILIHVGLFFFKNWNIFYHILYFHILMSLVWYFV